MAVLKTSQLRYIYKLLFFAIVFSSLFKVCSFGQMSVTSLKLIIKLWGVIIFSQNDNILLALVDKAILYLNESFVNGKI